MVFPNRPIGNEQEMFASTLISNESRKPIIQISGKPDQELDVGVQYFREKCDYTHNPPPPSNCPLSDINSLK
jgi:hypothetical protein